MRQSKFMRVFNNSIFSVNFINFRINYQRMRNPHVSDTEIRQVPGMILLPHILIWNYEDKLIINSNIYVVICDSLSEIHTMPLNESWRGPNANSCTHSSPLRNQPARYEKDVSAKCVRTEVLSSSVQVDTQSR